MCVPRHTVICWIPWCVTARWVLAYSTIVPVGGWGDSQRGSWNHIRGWHRWAWLTIRSSDSQAHSVTCSLKLNCFKLLKPLSFLNVGGSLFGGINCCRSQLRHFWCWNRRLVLNRNCWWIRLSMWDICWLLDGRTCRGRGSLYRCWRSYVTMGSGRWICWLMGCKCWCRWCNGLCCWELAYCFTLLVIKDSDRLMTGGSWWNAELCWRQYNNIVFWWINWCSYMDHWLECIDCWVVVGR